jgi:hypothetical protein
MLARIAHKIRNWATDPRDTTEYRATVVYRPAATMQSVKI